MTWVKNRQVVAKGKLNLKKEIGTRKNLKNQDNCGFRPNLNQLFG